MIHQQPLYRQIAELLREKIEKGEYQFGQFIPSERELSAKYGVNRLTLRKAIALLVNEGLLIPNPEKAPMSTAQRLIPHLTPFKVPLHF